MIHKLFWIRITYIVVIIILNNWLIDGFIPICHSLDNQIRVFIYLFARLFLFVLYIYYYYFNETGSKSEPVLNSQP